MLNPFFNQSHRTEQGLIQDLVNEQIRMFGIECQYIPRKFVTTKSIIEEVIQSKFEQTFPIEAYVNTFDGFSGQGDILSKFGLMQKDELVLTISRERFETAISPFLEASDEVNSEKYVRTRPKEGDIIYFPLSKNFFEIKFVEHEKPFYQLGKLYTYELKCELFEYEDELIDTGIEEVDSVVQNEGYIAKLILTGIGSTASAFTGLVDGAIRTLFVEYSGYGYNSPPNVSISTAPSGGITASAVGVITSSSGISTSSSIHKVFLINPGRGYVGIPTVKVSGVGIVTAGISTQGSIGIVTITSGGSSYATKPTVTFSSPSVGWGITAIGEAVVSAAGTLSQIRILNAGLGYTTPPSITIGSATTIGNGTFIFNENVTAKDSKVTARVKFWNKSTSTLEVGITSDHKFRIGEIITGSDSNAAYAIKSIVYDNQREDNDDIEDAASSILDFTERNPFGSF
jgi:hypothetical protein